MRLRQKFAAIAASTTLMGTFFLVEIAHATPCIYGQQGGVTEGTPSDTPVTGTTTAQAEFDNFNKLGLVGAGFAVLGGFLAGGVILKRQLDRKSEPLAEEVHVEVSPTEPSEPCFVTSEFRIVIPPEVRQSLQASQGSELNSVR